MNLGKVNTSTVILAFSFFLKAQNPAIITIPSAPTPNPPNLTVDSYTRATSSIKLLAGFKYGFVTANATNLLNLNISSLPGFVNQAYNNSLNSTNNCQVSVDFGKVVGETKGDLSVSNSGAAICSIPILTSPGTSAVVPNLSVFYNSQSGFGELGYGFHLGGISSISRTGKIPINDGTYSGISLTSNDYFALEGSRLLLSPGSSAVYGADNSTYRTELENFATITAHSQQGNGPEWFEVKDKLGNVMQFGNSSDSRLTGLSNTSVLTWKINKITDEFGNYINYKYKYLAGETVIDKIEYTGNSSAGVLPYNSIEFNYIPLAEKNSYFVNGVEFRTTQLLKSIVCKAEGLPAHRYVFSYNWDNNKTILTSVQEIDAQGNELNPTGICWNDLNEFANYKNNQNSALFTAAAEYTDLKSAIPADLDGDGFSDFVCVYQGTAPNSTTGGNRVKVLRNNFQSDYGTTNSNLGFSKIYDDDQAFFQITDWGNGPGMLLNSCVIDDNLDNIQEVYTIIKPRIGSNSYTIDKISGTSSYASITNVGVFNNLNSAINANFSPPQFFYDKGDYTGDGEIDELRIDPENIIITSVQGNLNFSVSSPQNTVSRPIEFDGDGIPEFLTLKYIGGSTNVTATVYKLVKGNSVLTLSQLFTMPITLAPAATTRNLLDHIAIADYNGDGLSDLVALNDGITKIMVFYSNGQVLQPPKNINTSFSSSVVWLNGGVPQFQLSPADLNNDGKSDLIITAKQNNAGLQAPNYFTFYFIGGGQVIEGPSYSGNFELTKVDYVEYTNMRKDNRGQIYSYDMVQKHRSIITGIGVKADFNGDGYTDIASINSPTQDLIITNNASGFSNSAVSTVYTGMRRRIDIRYGNIANEIFLGFGANKEEVYRNSAEYFGPGQPAQTVYTSPLYKYRPNLFCVHMVTRASGFNHQILTTTKYIYENAILHKKGRGFLGFESVYTFDSKTKIGVKKTNDFSNPLSVPLNIKNETYKFSSSTSPKKQVPTVFPNTLMSSSENVYSIVQAAVNNKFLRLDQVEDIDYLNSSKSKTAYTYDLNSSGNILTTISTSEAWTTNAPIVSETTNYTYIQNNGTYKINSSSTTKTQQGNPASTPRTVNYIYLPDGRIDKIINDVGMGVNALTTTFSQYNLFGKAVKKTISAGDIASREIQSVYDAYGRFIVNTINANGDQKEFVYDAVYGNVLEEKDVTGLTTTMEYDGLGRLSKTIFPDNSISKVTYNWDQPGLNYNYNGGVRLGVYSILKETESKPYVKEYYAPDVLLRTETQGLTDVVVADNKYNTSGVDPNLPNGYLLETTEPHYLNQPTYLATKLEYEPTFYRNKREKVYFVNGGSYTYKNVFSETSYNAPSGSNYSRRTVSSQDQSGKFIQKAYNAAGQLEEVLNSSANNSQLASYEYNSLGEIKNTKLTSGLNSQVITTSFLYNSLGQQTDINDPSVGNIHYDYNTLGELTARTEPNNVVWTYQYDLIGRMTSKTGPSGTTTYQYVTASAGKNLIQSVNGPNVLTEFKYDNLSRLIETKEQLPSKVLKTNYVLDKYGRVIQRSYPGGFITKNNYNSINQLTQITDADDNLIWQLSDQDALSDIKSYILGNGISTTIVKTDLHYLAEKQYANMHKQEYVYEPLTGNLKSRKFTRYSPANAIVLQEKFDYFSDDKLKLVNQVDQSNPQQVIQSNNTSFDPIGNITHKDDAGDYQYTVPNKPYVLSSIANPVGNISLNTLNVSYNDLNKVSQISEMGTNKQMDFTYGNDDERIEVDYTINGINQYTRYYAENYERQESNSGYKEWTYIVAPTGLCAVHYNNNGTKQLLYALTDNLGSPLALLNSAQAIVEEYSFDSWGRRRNPNDWSYSNVAMPTFLNRGFTFHEHIDEFALVNMNGRVYDPVIGRFIQPDKHIQEADNLQNFNRYSYSLNNPLRYTDPNGQYFVADDIAAVAVGFMIGVTTHLLSGGQLDAQAVIAGLKGAALAEIAWLTFGSGVAVGNFVAAQIGNAALANISPMSVNVYNNDGLSLSVGFSAFSPFGFSPFASVNLAYTAHMGDAYVTIGSSIGMGASYNQFTKEQTALSMLAGGVELGYGEFGLGANTAYFDSKGVKSLASTSQRIGGITIRAGDFNFRYENDFMGYKKNIKKLADGGDRWRTASIRASYKDFSIGFKLATDDPGYPKKGMYEDKVTGRDTYKESHDYRLGAVYVGYQNLQLGWNSEAIRHNIQNKFAHDFLQNGESKWFKVLQSSKPGVYGNNSPYYKYSLW